MTEQEVKIKYVSKCFASCINCGKTFDIYDNPKYKHFVCSGKCADEFKKQCESDIKQLQDEELAESNSIRACGLRTFQAVKSYLEGDNA
jgi:hypothetical protein